MVWFCYVYVEVLLGVGCIDDVFVWFVVVVDSDVDGEMDVDECLVEL